MKKLFGRKKAKADTIAAPAEQKGPIVKPLYPTAAETVVPSARKRRGATPRAADTILSQTLGG